jgi:hypothetical protein
MAANCRKISLVSAACAEWSAAASASAKALCTAFATIAMAQIATNETSVAEINSVLRLGMICVTRARCWFRCGMLSSGIGGDLNGATVDSGPFVVALPIEMVADDSPFPLPPNTGNYCGKANPASRTIHTQH